MRNVPSVVAAMLAIGLSVVQAQSPAPADAKSATVYKQVGCGCCSIWAEQLKKLGFKVSTMEIPDLAKIKNTYGVPQAAHTCHTALIDGYVIEGHVPAEDIARLLRDRPQAMGLAVPGMPIGSPGMEGGTAERYNVLAFERNGTTRVYAKR